MDQGVNWKELNTRVRAMFYEIELTYVKQIWVNYLIEHGITESDAKDWASTIEHTLEAFQMGVTSLLDTMGRIFESDDHETIAFELLGWVDFTLDLPISNIQDLLKPLYADLQSRIPPEFYQSDDDEVG